MSSTTLGVRRPEFESQPASRRPRLVAGSLAVLLLLGTTRWGSYVGQSPVFLTDLLVAAAVLGTLVGRQPHDGPATVREGYQRSAPLLLMSLLGYVVVRMLLSGDYALTQAWVRDGVPYLYILLALLSGSSIARSSAASAERTMTWIWRALIFHLVWVCIAGFVGPLSTVWSNPRPLLEGGFFYARPDIDTAVLGITAGLLLRRVLIGHRRVPALLGLALTALAISNFITRAGFIAVGACLFLGLFYAYIASGHRNLRRIGIVLMLPVAVVTLGTVLPSTTVGGRLLATVNPTGATQTAAQNAVGTEKARRLTWDGVVSWTVSEQSREVFGAGMGIDILAESHTLQYLEGTAYENVRSPHDYLIGSMARLGLVGLGFLILVMGRLLGRMFTFRRRIADDELLVAAALTVVAIVTVASLGVVLEAPFGAVPFWWCAGILFALAKIKPGTD